MIADMDIEEAAQGIGENQCVVKFLRNFLVNEGAVALAEGCTQSVRLLVITDLLDCTGLDVRHVMETKKGADSFPRPIRSSVVFWEL